MNQKQAIEHIKYVRKFLHESQKEFGERLGVSAGTICNWEKGKHKISKKGMDFIQLKLDNPPLTYAGINHIPDDTRLTKAQEERAQAFIDANYNVINGASGGTTLMPKSMMPEEKYQFDFESWLKAPEVPTTVNFEKHYMFKAITIAGKEYLVPPDNIIVRDAIIDDRKFVLLHFEYAKK